MSLLPNRCLFIKSATMLRCEGGRSARQKGSLTMQTLEKVSNLTDFLQQLFYITGFTLWRGCTQVSTSIIHKCEVQKESY